MPCPVCSHTMQNLGSPERRIWWCGRCGSLKEESGKFSHVEMPSGLRQVLSAAQLAPGRKGVSQRKAVSAWFDVRQYDEEVPRIELVVQDSLGRRLV